VEGIAAYGHFGGDLISLQLGTGSFGGTPTPAFFTHDKDSPAFSDPMFGGTGTGGGTDAILWSGAATAGSTGCGIQASDSTGSGVPNGEVAVIGGVCAVQGNLTVGGSNLLSSGASTTIPATAPSRTTLGSTWNATTASQCNQNFVNIINALGSVGIFV
jgi:hypothetical protein